MLDSVMRGVSTLKPHPKNARTHSKKQLIVGPYDLAMLCTVLEKNNLEEETRQGCRDGQKILQTTRLETVRAPSQGFRRVTGTSKYLNSENQKANHTRTDGRITT